MTSRCPALRRKACGKRSNDLKGIESRSLLVRNAAGTSGGCRGRRHAVEAAESRPAGSGGHQLDKCPRHRQWHSNARPAEQLPQSSPGGWEQIGQHFQMAPDLGHAQPAVHASCTGRRRCGQHTPQLAHSSQQPMDCQCCADSPWHRHTRQQAAHSVQQQAAQATHQQWLQQRSSRHC